MSEIYLTNCKKCGKITEHYKNGNCIYCMKKHNERAVKSGKSKKAHAKYFKENKEKALKSSKDWKRTHKKCANKLSREWAKTHRKQANKSNNKWRKTEKGKKYQRKRAAKRKRGLGFLPLNSPFKGSHGHHINKTVVIYIPTELHRSVPHNVFKGGEGLDKINHLAFEWLKKQTKEPETQGGAF